MPTINAGPKIQQDVRASNVYDCLQFSKLRFSTLLVLSVLPGDSAIVGTLLLLLLLLHLQLQLPSWLLCLLIEFRIRFSPIVTPPCRISVVPISMGFLLLEEGVVC